MHLKKRQFSKGLIIPKAAMGIDLKGAPIAWSVYVGVYELIDEYIRRT